MRETWYKLESGAVADPIEVAPDKAGVLRHKSGVAVAMRGQVPSTCGVEPEEERAKAARPVAKPPVSTTEPPVGKAPPEAKEMVPEKPKAGYKTRQMKTGKNRWSKTR